MALTTLTSGCTLPGQGFVGDNSAANGMVKGCLDKVANGTATVRMTNLRAISFALYGDALASASGSILDAGGTVKFSVGGPKEAQPDIVAADLSPLALGYQLTDITLRLLPRSGVFAKAGTYGAVLKAIVEAEGKAWQGAQILTKLKAGDIPARPRKPRTRRFAFQRQSGSHPREIECVQNVWPAHDNGRDGIMGEGRDPIARFVGARVPEQRTLCVHVYCRQ